MSITRIKIDFKCIFLQIKTLCTIKRWIMHYK